jgi:hypothetical protein
MGIQSESVRGNTERIYLFYDALLNEQDGDESAGKCTASGQRKYHIPQGVRNFIKLEVLKVTVSVQHGMGFLFPAQDSSLTDSG